MEKLRSLLGASPASAAPPIVTLSAENVEIDALSSRIEREVGHPAQDESDHLIADGRFAVIFRRFYLGGPRHRGERAPYLKKTWNFFANLLIFAATLIIFLGAGAYLAVREDFPG